MSFIQISKALFAVMFFAVLTGYVSTPIALALGIAFGMLFVHPLQKRSAKWAKLLLQLSVIALGFGMNFGEVLRAGRASFLYTAIGISIAMTLGLALGKLCGVQPRAAFLITVGTAICGGSAIAAIAPITNPGEDELAMSMGTVFTLNSVALFLFPAIGFALHLTQTQFGLWAALAIHDTSSVVGAAAKFGGEALAVGTVVKLTRALWIVPVALITAFFSGSKTRIQFPWFILLFCLAALCKTRFAGMHAAFAMLTHAGHVCLALTLFLIGTSISIQTVKRAGVRVMAQGLALWIVIAVASLMAIHAGWVRL